MMTATPPADAAPDERQEAAPALPTKLNVLRCWRCGEVIARLFLVPGCVVEIKCGHCRAFNTAAIEGRRLT